MDRRAFGWRAIESGWFYPYRDIGVPILTNPRHELFAQELAKGSTAEAAYSKAGYAPSVKNAQRLKSNEGIRSRVAELIGQGAEKAEITVARVLQEIGRLGFADLRRGFDEQGQLKRPQEWDDDFAASVASIEVVTKNLGEGEVEYVHKIKTWDKNSALEKLAKHLNMFVERQEITGRLEIVSKRQRDAAVTAALSADS
jgi:phage terminase small subunit